MNTKVQSNVGLGQAISYFTSLGYSVSIPLTESQRYDLIVDDGDKLNRVEVKTTKTLDDTISLRTKGGNQSWGGEVSRISSKDCEYVFCYSLLSKKMYLFPSTILEGRATVKLCEKYDEYEIK